MVFAVIAIDSLWNGLAPVFNGDVFLLVVVFGAFDSGGNGFAVQAGSFGVGQGEERRGQISVTGHNIQLLALWNARAADDKRDVDVGFYS